MKKFRFVVFGAGKISKTFCDAARIAGHEVVAVGSKSMERAKKFAEDQNIPEYFDSYEEMLDKVKPDGAYIGTTHNFHYDNIMLCLSKKVPVLCEKCMVCTKAEAEAIFAEAKKQNTFVMEAMWSRFLPHNQQVKKWIEDGKIGEVELATSVIAFSAEFNPESRIFNPDLAGGSIWDVGVYALELLTYYLGEHPTEVKTMITRCETGVDKSAVALMRFSNCLGIAQSGVMSCVDQGVSINGRNGRIWIPWANVGREAYLYDRHNYVQEHFICNYPNGFVFEVEELVRCVEAGLIESPVVPWDETIWCAGVFDQALSE